MYSNRNLNLSKSSLLPPTIKVKLPDFAPWTPPETGASNIRIFLLPRVLQTSFVVLTSMVEQSINVLLGLKLLINSLTISLTINPEGNIVKTMSTSLRSVGMDGIIVISGNFIELSVSKPNTSKPFLAKFFAIGAPILPRPMKPIFKFISIF